MRAVGMPAPITKDQGNTFNSVGWTSRLALACARDEVPGARAVGDVNKWIVHHSGIIIAAATFSISKPVKVALHKKSTCCNKFERGAYNDTNLQVLPTRKVSISMSIHRDMACPRKCALISVKFGTLPLNNGQKKDTMSERWLSIALNPVQYVLWGIQVPSSCGDDAFSFTAIILKSPLSIASLWVPRNPTIARVGSRNFAMPVGKPMIYDMVVVVARTSQFNPILLQSCSIQYIIFAAL